MNQPRLIWADIWVLQAIEAANHKDPFDWVYVIAAGDGLNHAILTFEELNNAVYRLKEHGLVDQEGEGFFISVKTKEIFEQSKGESLHKRWDALKKLFDPIPYSDKYNPNQLDVPVLAITQEQYTAALEKYQNKDFESGS